VEAVPWAEALQIAGWLLTVLGQVQVASKARRGFLTWIAANAVLIVLCVHAGLWWSIGMYTDQRRRVPLVVPAPGRVALIRARLL
jgi:hypothetical protein